MPGYDTKKYKSLQEADKAKDSYGYQIIRILENILKMPKEGETMGRRPIIAKDVAEWLDI